MLVVTPPPLDLKLSYVKARRAFVDATLRVSWCPCRGCRRHLEQTRAEYEGLSEVRQDAAAAVTT